MKQKNLFVTVFFTSLLLVCHEANSFPKQFFKSFLPENAIIVDAGAYDGTDTAQLSALWPLGNIYAFEPVPNLFKRLEMNTRNCNNVVITQKALSDTVGSFAMHISQGGDQSSSLLEPDQQLYKHFPHITFPYSIMVEAITLDAWAEQMGIDRVDFLWFDLQGMEPMVLQASPKIFKTVKAVYAEVSYSDLYKQAPLYPVFKAWMEEHGFVALLEVKEHSTFGCTLFIRKEVVYNNIDRIKEAMKDIK